MLGGPPKTYVSPPLAPVSGLTSEAAAPTFLTQEEQQRAEELEPYEQAPGGPQDPPAGGGDEGSIPGLGVPYRDFIPFAPMVKDPATGQWRNAEPGEIPGAEGGEAGQTPPPVETEDPGSQAQEVSPLQFGNTGNFNNAPTFLQYASESDDFEPGGIEFAIEPEMEVACESAVQQSSAASG